MIPSQSQDVAIDGPAESGQDYIKVIRPINDIRRVEVVFERM